jgi:pimeloyl-ACP methyl ester carboxylesterase
MPRNVMDREAILRRQLTELGCRQFTERSAASVRTFVSYGGEGLGLGRAEGTFGSGAPPLDGALFRSTERRRTVSGSEDCRPALRRDDLPPARVRSLISIMSTTGAKRIGRPTLASYARLFRPVSAEVIHGDRDPMVDPTGGWATSRAIRHSRLLTIRGMGHDLPVGAFGELIEAIAEHAHAAE